MADLSGRRIAVLATDGVEQIELTEPVQVLKQARAEVVVVAPHGGEIQGMNHDEKGAKSPLMRRSTTPSRTSSTHWCCRAAWPIRTSCA